jgi:hypothetical protein
VDKWPSLPLAGEENPVIYRDGIGALHRLLQK